MAGPDTTAQVHPKKLSEALVAGAEELGATLRIGEVQGVKHHGQEVQGEWQHGSMSGYVCVWGVARCRTLHVHEHEARSCKVQQREPQLMTLRVAARQPQRLSCKVAARLPDSEAR